MLLAVIAGLVLVLPTGGSYERLRLVEVRYSGIFLAGAIMQFILAPVLSRDALAFGPAVTWIVGAALLLVGCLANRDKEGLLLAGTGVALNASVIALNVGMPVYPEALRVAGAPVGFDLEIGSIYRLADDGTRLLLLADVVPVPGPALVQSVASLGDLLICVGVIVTILQASVPGIGRAPNG